MRRFLAWVFILAVSFSPLFFWYQAFPFPYRVSGASSIFLSLGEVTGLVGLTMYSLSIILSSKFKIVERLFGGLNVALVNHHLLGGVSFILILFHPLFNASSKLPESTQAALSYILPGKDWAINLGIAALLFTIALLLLTFFVALPYQQWKTTHKFLGLVFLIGGVHGFFVTSDISRYDPLKAYMLVILTLGLISWFHSSIYVNGKCPT